MRQLEVPAHVFVCRDGDFVMLLDLHNDRYWAVEAAKTLALASIVRGWPARADQAPAIAAGASAAELLSDARPLIERGLLCDARDSSRDATPVRVDAPHAELLAEPGSRHAGKSSVASFLVAAAAAVILIRCLSFERLVSRVRRRKQSRNGAAAPLDVQQVAQLIHRFEELRPLLFSARDACLLNSLALIEFLARHDLYPQWVFGVQARPFAAHCWVQHEGIVFNDSLEHVRRFTPIMAI